MRQQHRCSARLCGEDIRSYMQGAAPGYTGPPACEEPPGQDYAYIHFLSKPRMGCMDKKGPAQKAGPCSFYFSASRAAFTFSGLAGISVILAPVALKIALRMAGCPAVKGPSPHPDAPYGPSGLGVCT